MSAHHAPDVDLIGHEETDAEIGPLVRAGADFIALGEEVVWSAAEGPAAALSAASVHLGIPERVL